MTFWLEYTYTFAKTLFVSTTNEENRVLKYICIANPDHVTLCIIILDGDVNKRNI